jgi:hypothetical protein
VTSHHFCSGDEDVERKTQAEVLLNAYSRELERRRLNAGANGLFRVGGKSRMFNYRGIVLTAYT